MRVQRLVFPRAWQAEWEEVELDESLAANEMLVEASTTMINYGTLVAIYTGTHININNPNVSWPKFPHYPGSNTVATVCAVGSAVSDFQVGDRVCFMGTFARLQTVDASSGRILKVPANVSDLLAAVAAHSTISLNGIRLGQVTIGDRVGVFGQGVIGQYALQYAKVAGATTVIAVDPIKERLAISKECGADVLISPDGTDVEAEIKAITGGKGLDVVVEATGNPAVVSTAMKVAGWRGRVVLLGSPRGRVEIDPYNDIHRKGTIVIGAHAQTAPAEENSYYPWTTERNTLVAWELVAQGRLNLERLVSHRLKATDSADLFDKLARQRDQYLGVALDWGGD